MISRVKTILYEMLLYNIKVVVHSVAGKTKESLLSLVISNYYYAYNIMLNFSHLQIYATPKLTMIVCGARERSALKG